MDRLVVGPAINSACGAIALVGATLIGTALWIILAALWLIGALIGLGFRIGWIVKLPVDFDDDDQPKPARGTNEIAWLHAIEGKNADRAKQDAAKRRAEREGR